jgi:hypothetical protein
MSHCRARGYQSRCCRHSPNHWTSNVSYRNHFAIASLIGGLALFAPLAVAGPASAAGGRTPATTTSPAPVSAGPLDCFGDFGDPTIPNMTAPDVAVNYAGNAGCVGVQSTGGSLRLAWVVLAPDWTYVVKSNGTGTTSRIQIQFTNSTTGSKIDFRFEFGKTVIG